MATRRSFFMHVLAAGAAVFGMNPGAAHAQSGSAALDDVSLGIPFAAVTYLPPVLGVEMGLFEQHGIHLRIEYIQPGPLIPAVASGAVNFGLLPGPVPHEMTLADSGASVLLTSVKRPEIRLMASAGVGTVAELRGKPVAVGAAGSSMSRMFMLEGLRDGGLDPVADVEHRTLAGQGDSMNALLSGQVDAAVLGLPFFLIAEARGAKVLVDYTSADLAWPSNNLVGLEDWTADNREVTIRFLKGYLDALDEWKNSPDEARALIAREARIDDEALVDSMYQLSLELLSTGEDALPTAAEHQVVLDRLLSISKTDPSVRSPEGRAVEEFFNADYLNEALAR